MSTTVKIIGICGYPQHGKSSAQRFLEHLGVVSYDDSAALRLLTMGRYDLTWDDVATQEGKSGSVCRPDYGDTVTVRQAIGDLGKEYEKEHGPNYWIELAIAGMRRDDDSSVSFGSVRMGQAHAIRAAGGFVVAIRDPRRPLSIFDFDQFDPTGVDCWVENDSTLWHLEHRIHDACIGYLGSAHYERLLERQQVVGRPLRAY